MLLYVSGITCIDVSGQDSYKVNKYDSRHGLSGRYIRKVYKDDKGFIWVGTPSGLNRFDGQNFKSYSFSKDKSKYTPEADIFEITQDYDKSILAVSQEFGIARLTLDPIKGYSVDTSFPLMKSMEITSFLVVKDGYWIASGNSGIWLYNRLGKVLHKVLEGENILSLVKDPQGNIYANTWREIYRLSPSMELKLIIKNGSFFRGVYDKINVCIWYFSDSTLTKFSPDKLRMESSVYVRNNPNINIQEVAPYKNRIIISTNKGLFIYYLKSKDVDFPQLTSHLDNIKNGLATTSLFVEENSDILWMGSERGLIKLKLSHTNFSIHNLNFDQISGFRVRCITEIKKDTFWVGTNDGIYEIKIKDKQVYFIQKFTKEFSFTNNINKILVHNKEVWVTGNVSIFRFALDGKLIESFPINLCWGFDFDEQNNLWAGSNLYGLYKINLSDKSIQQFLADTISGELTNKKNTIWDLKNHGNVIWLATNFGLMEFNKKTKKFSHLFTNVPWTNISVWKVPEKGRNIFVQTNGAGAWEYDAVSGNYSHRISSPLRLYGYVYDQFNSQWIVAESGLVKVEANSRGFDWYSSSDGIHTDFLSFIGQCNSSSGNLMFVGENALTIVDPKLFTSHNKNLTVKFSSLKIYGKEYSDFVQNGEKITLPYQNNYLSISLSSSPEDETRPDFFIYRLEGVDMDWKLSKNDNEATYTELKPGTYKFLAAKANTSEIISSELTIEILPPYWETWWFRTLTGSFLILLIMSIILSNLGRYKTRNKLLISEIDTLRLQMNPHFIFNSLNSIQDFIIKNDKKNASVYLSKFAQLMRQILENSKQELISIENEIHFLKLYLELESLRMNKDFKYDVIVAEEVDNYNVSIPPMIIQPIVENSLKHGFAEKAGPLNLDITISFEGKFILISVSDNGIGRKASLNKGKNDFIIHRSFGLDVVKQRLILLSRSTGRSHEIELTDLEDEYGNGTGTRVDIYIEQ